MAQPQQSESDIPPVPVLADEHIWNLDVTLAAIIAQGVRRLSEFDNGYPAFPGADTMEEWRAVLAEMADGFEEYATEKRDVLDYAGVERSLDLLRAWFPHLWD